MPTHRAAAAAAAEPPTLEPVPVGEWSGRDVIGRRIARRSRGRLDTGWRITGAPRVERGRRRVPVVSEEAWWRFILLGTIPTPTSVLADRVWIVP